MLLFQTLADLKGPKAQLEVRLSDTNRKALKEWGVQNISDKDKLENYNRIIDQSKTWGDIKRGFSDLNLNFNSFLDWYQKEYLDRQRLGFTLHGGGPPPAVKAQLWLVGEEKRKRIRGTTKEIIGKAQEGKEQEKEGIEKTSAETKTKRTTITINKSIRVPKRQQTDSSSEEYGRGG